MTNSSARPIVESLPYLRRYAHALTGSQARGDTYVRACLEVVSEEPERLRAGDDIKLELFKLFHRVWRMVDDACSSDAEGPAVDARLRRGLAALRPINRQVLLLATVEGFAIDEVAEIVEVTEARVARLLDEARQEMRDRTGARVLIIEDEAMVAADIGHIVDSLGHTVVGIAGTERRAFDMARQQQPELVLADTRLQNGDSGIKAVEKIRTATNAPVIFVSSFPERIPRREKIDPIFVVTKPFKPESLKNAIGQALSMRPPRLLDQAASD